MPPRSPHRQRGRRLRPSRTVQALLRDRMKEVCSDGGRLPRAQLYHARTVLQPERGHAGKPSHGFRHKMVVAAGNRQCGAGAGSRHERRAGAAAVPSVCRGGPTRCTGAHEQVFVGSGFRGRSRNAGASVFGRCGCRVSADKESIFLNEQLRGLEAIYTWLHDNQLRPPGRPGHAVPHHFLSSPIAEVHGDVADLRFVLHGWPGNFVGAYAIKAVRTRDGWRISHLRLESMTESAMTSPEEAARD